MYIKYSICSIYIIYSIQYEQYATYPFNNGNTQKRKHMKK